MKKATVLLFIVVLAISLGVVYYTLTVEESQEDLNVSITSPTNDSSYSSSFVLNATIQCQNGECGNTTSYPISNSFRYRGESIEIGIFGDVQTSDAEYLPSYSESIRGGRKGFPETDFTVSVGDVVGGSTGNYPTEEAISDSTNQIYNYQTTPFFQVVGNHDMSDWKNRANKPWLGEWSLENESGVQSNTYAFEYNNALFMVLGDEGGEARLKKQQLAWIDSIVGRYPHKPIFVFMHPEPTEHNSCGNQNRDYMHHLNEREDYSWYSSDFISRDNVKMVVHGHCEDLSDDTFDGYYDVVNDTVTVGVPSFRGLFGQTEDNAYLKITESKIAIRMWDEETDKFVETRTHKSDLDLNSNGFEDYYLPHFFQDGERWRFYNKIVGKNPKVNLIGTNYTGKGYNNHFNKFVPSDEKCGIGFPGYQGGAEDDSVSGTVIFSGTSELRHTDTDEICGNDAPHHVMPTAVPRADYKISVNIRGDSNHSGAFDIKVNYISFDEGLDSPVSNDTIKSGIDVKSNYQKKDYEFTVPDNENIDLMQIVWQSNRNGTYYMDSYNLARNGSEKTKNFTVKFNERRVSSKNQNLTNSETFTANIDASLIDYKNNLSASVDGNKNGIFELKYTNPIAQSLSGAVNVESVDEDNLTIGIKRTGSYNNRIKLLPMTDIVTSTVPKEDAYHDSYYYVKNEDSPVGSAKIVTGNEEYACYNNSLCIETDKQDITKNVEVGQKSKSVSWRIYPKGSGTYNLSVFATSSKSSEAYSDKVTVDISDSDTEYNS